MEADPVMRVAELSASLHAVITAATCATFPHSSPFELIARGKYGDVYRCADFPISSVLRWLRNSPHAKSLVVSSSVLGDAEYKDIVVKLQPMPNDQWDRDAVAEDNCHNIAHRRTRNAATPVVPAFWYGATVKMPSVWLPKAASGVRITIMEHLAEADTVGRLHRANSTRLDNIMYQRIEYAVCALWCAGIAHCDLHLENIVLMPDDTIRLMDFGMATVMPRRLSASMRRKLANRKTPPDVCFDELYMPRAAIVMQRRGVHKEDNVNYDSGSLRWFHAQMVVAPDTANT